MDICLWNLFLFYGLHCGLYYKHVIHDHMPVKLHFCVINIPNVSSHSEMSLIMGNWPWGYKIGLIFSIHYGYFFIANKWAWKIMDICPWPRTNDCECVYNTGHRKVETIPILACIEWYLQSSNFVDRSATLCGCRCYVRLNFLWQFKTD
jgi:hypothetical protein